MTKKQMLDIMEREWRERMEQFTFLQIKILFESKGRISE